MNERCVAADVRRRIYLPPPNTASSRRWPHGLTCWLGTLLVIASTTFAPAAEAKKEEPKVPKVLLAVPFAVIAGQTNRVEVRGLNLDLVKSVQFEAAGVVATVKSAGKSEPPKNTKKERLGDTQVALEVVVPASVGAAELTFKLETPTNGTATAKLRVLRRGEFTEEKEENGSFTQPQALQLPTLVRGSIKGAQDVDIFQFEGRAGWKLTAEVLAGRAGSPCDPLLTLWSGQRTMLRSDDDSATERDARLTFTLPADGKYFLVVQDAHDQGGPAYGYHLSVQCVP